MSKPQRVKDDGTFGLYLHMFFKDLPPDSQRTIKSLIAIVLCVWALCLLFAFRAASVGNCIEITGQMGDTFGIITSLTSCFALVAAVSSFIMQNSQIQLERAKARREHELNNLERVAFAFRKVSQLVSGLLLDKADMIMDSTAEQASLKLTLSNTEIQTIRMSLLDSQTEAEILVSSHFDTLVTEVEDLQEKIKIFTTALPTIKRAEYAKLLLEVVDAAERGRKKAVILIKTVTKNSPL